MAPPESDPTHAAAPPALRFQWKEYRLLFYSALIGVAGGLAAQLFVWLLNTAEHFLLFGIAGYKAPEPGVLDPVAIVGAHGLWLVPVVTTLGGLVSGFLVYTFAPEAEGHGTDAAVESFHYKGGKIRPIVPLIKALSSAVTIGSGGAAGREGPTAQISVGVGSILADLLRLPDEERRILVLAGMAAGLAAIFKSPLGMAIFAVEILYSGMAFETEALIYTIVASVIAYAVNGLFAGWTPIFLFPGTVHFTRPVELAGYTALGVLAGVVGALEPTIFYRVRDAFKALRVPDHVKPAIGGLLVGLLALWAPEILSTGYGWIQKAMTGNYIGGFLIWLALLKIVAMSLTISSGGSGGVFGPNVYIGGMLGAWVAYEADRWIPGVGFMPPAFAVVGMAAVFAGTARVPVATMVMVAEMTGGYGLIVLVDARDRARLRRPAHDRGAPPLPAALRGAGGVPHRFADAPRADAARRLLRPRSRSAREPPQCDVSAPRLALAPRHADSDPQRPGLSHLARRRRKIAARRAHRRRDVGDVSRDGRRRRHPRPAGALPARRHAPGSGRSAPRRRGKRCEDRSAKGGGGGADGMKRPRRPGGSTGGAGLSGREAQAIRFAPACVFSSPPRFSGCGSPERRS